MRFGLGACITDNGPAIPIVYDTGNVDYNKNLYGPNSRRMSNSLEPVFSFFFLKKVATSVDSQEICALFSDGVHFTRHLC